MNGKGHDETVPFPEACGRSREGAVEPLAGAHVDRAIEQRKACSLECRDFQVGRMQHCSAR